MTRKVTARSAVEHLPDLSRGQRVIVDAPDGAPWAGVVGSVKIGARAVYVEVRHDNGITWAIPSQYVKAAP